MLQITVTIKETTIEPKIGKYKQTALLKADK